MGGGGGGGGRGEVEVDGEVFIHLNKLLQSS